MKYHLSLLAESDLTAIFELTIVEWGTAQAEKYALELHRCFEHLSTHPAAGLAREEIGPGVKRFKTVWRICHSDNLIGQDYLFVNYTNNPGFSQTFRTSNR